MKARNTCLTSLAMLMAGVLLGGQEAPRSETLVPLADPFILCEKGVYYAYGTHSKEGITVATSSDLVHWKMDQGRSKGGLALHGDDSFGRKWFWAPEVYRVGGRYLMYYSADLHVCAATADSPLGPFRQADKKPILERGGIDNSLFVDDDGRAWMVYVHFDRGNVVWLTEMEKDGLHAKPGTARMVLRAEKGWEMMNPRCSVTEGPFIVKIDGTYVLTYSANDYRDRDYAVGVATCRGRGDGAKSRWAVDKVCRQPDPPAAFRTGGRGAPLPVQGCGRQVADRVPRAQRRRQGRHPSPPHVHSRDRLQDCGRRAGAGCGRQPHPLRRHTVRSRKDEKLVVLYGMVNV